MKPMNLKRRANTWLGLLMLGGAVLYTFSPQDYHFYPVCPYYALTHMLCPGCGGTRALYYLLHGNLSQAWHYNALVTVFAPIVLGWFLAWYSAVMLDRRPPRFRLHWSAITFLFVLAGVFVIVRNTGVAFTI
jgi:hypothetical protein